MENYSLDGLEGPRHEHVSASHEAVAFMDNIDPKELQRCVFTDNLVSLSESGRDLGKFSVSVEFACRAQQPCMLVHAQSQGAIEDSLCGTTVTAYVTCDLEVLEEDYYEYMKLEDRSLEKRCHVAQCDGNILITKVTTEGQEVTEQNAAFPLSVARGLITEGSHLLLMRLFALKGKVPENMTFISIDQNLHIISATFEQLGVEKEEFDGECMEVFGIKRTLLFSEDDPQTWHCYFLPDGHMVSRVQLGSPVAVKILQLPSYQEKVVEIPKMSLSWEEDMQMRSKFLDRKEEQKADHASYLRRHPEIRALISDFLQFLLLRKPDDVFQFAREYFLPFTCHHPQSESTQAVDPSI
ncbi:ciliogenesis-associated TTC17-interacting protein isoform X2 [Periophthalmus magnuspinnatus]|uniref:ciliogenesis-associated TTC17-interacting protein isoform X2 n=1 Tax=Periophthalmus magnuspinnatus TaxID=409849 RepID=UPI00145A3859|nr:ciliogenesis-associated TTC17-interacting protein isoform X2 [Periophthalmus magnuspinnatus]